MVGLMDNQGGAKRVQSKVIGDSYVVVREGEWTQCRIPLEAFVDDGMYWDAAQQREVGAKLDWAKIQDIRFSINRGENKVAADAPVVFYFDQIQLTRTSKGMVDPDAYWNAFASDARGPEVQLWEIGNECTETGTATTRNGAKTAGRPTARPCAPT